MINEESNTITFSKRVFSNILEGVVLKHLSGGSPQTPVFFRFTLIVVTGLSVSGNDMAWHVPISKTLRAVLFVLSYLSVQPGQ